MDWQTRIENKIDRIEQKLDESFQRINRNETSIEWMKGVIKIGSAALLSLLGAMAMIIYNYVSK